MNKRPLGQLLLGLLLLVLAVGIAILTDPNSIINLGVITVPALIVFLFVLFVAIGLICTYVWNNTRRGLLCAAFVVTFLLLRYFHFTQIFFTITLLGIFIALELFFTKQQ